MAEETVDASVKEFGLKPTGRSQTDHIKLLGGHAWSKTMYIKLIQQFGLETEVAKHLSESYGDRAWTVASMAEKTGMFAPLALFGPWLIFFQANPGPSTVSDCTISTPTSRLRRVMQSEGSTPSPPPTSSPAAPASPSSTFRSHLNACPA
jgi:hypothetical protein